MASHGHGVGALATAEVAVVNVPVGQVALGGEDLVVVHLGQLIQHDLNGLANGGPRLLAAPPVEYQLLRQVR